MAPSTATTPRAIRTFFSVIECLPAGESGKEDREEEHDKNVEHHQTDRDRKAAAPVQDTQSDAGNHDLPDHEEAQARKEARHRRVRIKHWHQHPEVERSRGGLCALNVLD